MFVLRGNDTALTMEETKGEHPEPKLAAAWMATMHADLMLHHLSVTGPRWPEANLYCHSCITALRSVTLMMQKALRHEPKFEAWYSGAQDRLKADREVVYLRDARNFVLKQGSLELLASFEIRARSPLPIEVRGVGPDGPDVWLRREEGPPVPVDWRRLHGFEFRAPMRFAPQPDLPPPPERDLVDVLRDAHLRMRLILHEAEALFDPSCADPTQAAADERELGRAWRDAT